MPVLVKLQQYLFCISLNFWPIKLFIKRKHSLTLKLPLHEHILLQSIIRRQTMGTVAVLSRAEFSGVGTASGFEFPGIFEFPGRIKFPGFWFLIAAPALQTAEWLLRADRCLNPWPQDAHRKGTTSAAFPTSCPRFPGI